MAISEKILGRWERVEIAKEIVAQLRAAGFRAERKEAYFADLPEYEIYVAEFGVRKHHLPQLPEDIRTIVVRAETEVRARWAADEAAELRAAAIRAERYQDEMRGY